jgi:5'-nucleotidase/UDP-sugar diphosphatase
MQKRRILSWALSLTMTGSLLPAMNLAVQAASPHSVTILYTNDVHGAIDGYSILAGYKAQLEEEDRSVFVVDAGDSVQGELIDQMTDGIASVELMNQTPYDYAVPGNHEFDYQMPQFLNFVKSANYKYLSCNFTKADGSTIGGVEAYAIEDLGGYKIGFVGISTPETYTKSTPTYFMDNNGNYVYSFNENALYSKVQTSVNDVRAKGANYVVAIGHTGMDGTQNEWNTQSIIANTDGIDAYIDGHSHEVIPGPDYKGTTFTNKDVESVIETSTGTKFAYIGRLDVDIAADGSATAKSQLIPTKEAATEITSDSAKTKQAEVQAIIDKDNAQVKEKMGEKIADSETALYINDPATGKRMVRNSESNAGDFVADAYRTVLDAEIGISNGGGIRTDLNAGTMTIGSFYSLNPFGNDLCVVKASGQQILDALEHASRNLPNENGGFLQVSGLTYEVNTAVTTPVVTDDKGSFKEIPAGAARRVRNVKVNGKAIDPSAQYTVAASKYMLVNGGDGMTMWKGAEFVNDPGIKDHDALIKYVQNFLKGKITSEKYGNPNGEGRITIVNEPVEKPTEPDKLETVDMYRLYNPNSGEHFYTSDQKEHDHLTSLGWKDEGIGWKAPESGNPVYRLYNANAGEHHYTMDAKEKDTLIRLGWKNEGVGWYSDTAKTVAVYRQYDTNRFANNHNYTADANEKDYLLRIGWRDEGIGWYAVSK